MLPEIGGSLAARRAALLLGEVGREVSRLSNEGHLGVLSPDAYERLEWADCDLSGAALCYAFTLRDMERCRVVSPDTDVFELLMYFWPLELDLDGFCPCDDRREHLVRASALLLLEIARLDFVEAMRDPARGSSVGPVH